MKRFPKFMTVETDLKWRVKKEIDIISLLTAIVLVFSCLSYVFKIEERISVDEKAFTLTLRHMNNTMESMAERHSEDYNRNTKQFEKLERKLDDTTKLFLTSSGKH